MADGHINPVPPFPHVPEHLFALDTLVLPRRPHRTSVISGNQRFVRRGTATVTGIAGLGSWQASLTLPCCGCLSRLCNGGCVHGWAHLGFSLPSLFVLGIPHMEGVATDQRCQVGRHGVVLEAFVIAFVGRF